MRNEYIITLHVEADDDGDMPTRDMPSQIAELFMDSPAKLLFEYGCTKIEVPTNRRPKKQYFKQVDTAVKKHVAELAKTCKITETEMREMREKQEEEVRSEYIVTIQIGANENGNMLSELSDAFEGGPIEFFGILGVTKVDAPEYYHEGMYFGEEVDYALKKHKNKL